MIDALAAGFIALGGLFRLVAGIGIVRLDDVYLRMHAATKAGALGLGVICVGVTLMAETWTEVGEALAVFLFMLASAPVGAHLIGRAAFRAHVAEAQGARRDPDVAAFRKTTDPAPLDDARDDRDRTPQDARNF